MCKYRCCLSRKMSSDLQKAQVLTKGRDRQKRSLADRIGLLIVAMLTRERLPTICEHPAGVHGAWPTAHGHRRVLQPGRSSPPGHMLVAGAISRQIAACIVVPPPFPPFFHDFLSSCSFSVDYVAVLTRERLPAICEYPAGVHGARPTAHGHRRVLQPGRSRPPSATHWPHRILARGHVCSGVFDIFKINIII